MRNSSEINLPDHSNTLVMSYLEIRRAIGVSGLLLPIILGPVGWAFFGVEIQDNMSSYYHTVLRDLFVGTLCAIGIFLYCYHGYGWIENWTANVGCAAALGIALFPLDYGSDPLHQKSVIGYLHTISGGVFFLTLAFYSLYHFPERHQEGDEPAEHNAEWNFVYRTSGIVILVSMLAMGGYLFLMSPNWKQALDNYHFLFWMEWVALWAFAAAWLAKAHTIVARIGVEMLAYSRTLLLKSENQELS